MFYRSTFRTFSVSFAIFLLFFSAALQAGGTQATLSGTITEVGTGTALEDVTIMISDLNQWGQGFSGVTDENGEFTVEVPMALDQTRNLIVEAAGPDHAPGRFNGSSNSGCYFNCGGSEGAFPVDEGQTIPSINFQLEPGGRFSGSVTAASNGSPIESTRISPRTSEDPFPVGFSLHFDAVSDSTGEYQSPLALLPGDYHLLAAPAPGANYVQQAWQGYTCQLGGCPIFDSGTIEISAGIVNSDLDFSLQAGATISGTLQPDNEQRIVRLFDGAGVMLDQVVVFLDLPDADWSFNGLSGGSYYIELGPVTGLPYIRQLHNDLLCPFSGCNRASGVPITIPPGSALTLADIMLQSGGQIEGSIVDSATGTAPPVVGTGQVGVYDIIKADGTIVGGGFIVKDAGELKLQASAAIPPGDYYVRTYNNWTGSGIGYGTYQASVPGYSDAMYPDVACAGQDCDISAATPVSVTDNAITEIVIEIATGSSINGSVIDDDTDEPVHRALVKLVNSGGDMLAAAMTDEQGEFSFGAFPAGDYYLRTSVSGTPGPGNFGVQNRYFDHLHGGSVPCSEMLCDPVSGSVVTLDGTADAGPFTLRVQPGPVISGRIVFALTGQLINNGYVEVYNDSGVFVGEYRINRFTGRYQTTALAPGDYTLVPVVSPAFADVTVSQNTNSLESSAQRGQRSGALVVTIGNEDVDADLVMIDEGLDVLFQDSFIGN